MAKIGTIILKHTIVSESKGVGFLTACSEIKKMAVIVHHSRDG